MSFDMLALFAALVLR